VQESHRQNIVGGTLGAGFRVGVDMGFLVDWALGRSVGFCVGLFVGGALGRSVGFSVGFDMGFLVGNELGRSVGFCVGFFVGKALGGSVGFCVGLGVGVLEGCTLLHVEGSQKGPHSSGNSLLTFMQAPCSDKPMSLRSHEIRSPQL